MAASSRRYIFVLIVLFSCIPVYSRGYAIFSSAVYGWNSSVKSYGGLDLCAELPFAVHFGANVALEYLTSSAFNATLVASPKLPLQVGELFADAAANCSCWRKYGISDFAFAVSAGYRMDYVSVQIGAMTHIIVDLDPSKTTGNVFEKPCLLYKLTVNFRPSDSVWNAGLGAANYTEFQYFRTCEPVYFLHARYDLSEKLGLRMQFELKPSGVFHKNAHLWGVSVRAGARYSF